MSCLEAGHILSNGFKITIFVFLQSQRQLNVKYRRKRDFAVLQRQQMDHMFTTSYSYQFNCSLNSELLFEEAILKESGDHDNGWICNHYNESRTMSVVAVVNTKI